MAQAHEPKSTKLRMRNFGAVALGGLLALVIAATGMAETATRNKRHDLASQMFGSSGESWSRIASALAGEQASQQTDATLLSPLPEARAAAENALNYSLGHVRAIRVLALDEFASGNEQTGRKLMELNAKMSWRDSGTQAWLFEQELRSGNYDKAMTHVDSLMRRGRLENRIFQFLTLALLDEKMFPPIVDQFSQQTGWRTRFFASAGRMSPAQYRGFRKLIAALKDTDAPVTRDEMLPYAMTNIERGDVAETVREWSEYFPLAKTDKGSGVEKLPWPTGSTQLTRPYPTDWRIARARNVRSQVTEDGTLQVRAEPGARGELAWRYYTPRSGSTAIRFGNLELGSTIQISAKCLPDGDKLYLKWDGGNFWRASLSSACSVYRLSIELPSGGLEEPFNQNIPTPELVN